jgi:predicted regulator of Ras-like GTPase activity (Roadblock/LC7/MglB family)
MSACALAAAIHASAGELGRQLDGRPFRGLHHAGRDRQLYLAEATTPRGAFIFLTVFDQESSLGLVRLYFDEFSKHLAAAAPASARRDEPVLEQKFEQELNRNLAALFGRG